jgi:IclR family acetate operon transcriptional repressor
MRNVLNTFRVLDEVAARRPIGVGELARVLGMPKSSVQRSLMALREAAWIKPAPGDVTKWTMTTKALRLGYLATDLNLRDAALPVMEELRETTNETIHLMIPEGSKIILIERMQTLQPVRIVLPLGIGLPLHASANGKAVLAYCSQGMVEQVIAAGLQSFSETTITDPEVLLAELAVIRQRGYATNEGEWRSDIAAVAAPVFDDGPEPAASLSISTPSRRMSPAVRGRFGELVTHSARALSEALGRRP